MIRSTDWEAKKNMYPPGIRNLVTFGLAPYILYMYTPRLRVSAGFFLDPIPPQKNGRVIVVGGNRSVPKTLI